MSLRLSLDDRRMLLADAPRYFTVAERVLLSCTEVLTTPLSPPLFQQDFGTWRGEITFTSGHILKFHEVYERHPGGLLKRIVNYDYRLKHASDVTFRVDAHGLPVIDDGEFHIDLANKMVVTESQMQSKGDSLAYFTMIDMVCLIRTHLEGKTLPWE